MSKDNKASQPKYSLEFKQDAARLILEKGYSQQQAAGHLGISLSALGRAGYEQNANRPTPNAGQ